jgi:branched-chain amino acid transport system ATP-binding protein
MALLVARGISKFFGGLSVLANVDFDVHQQEIVGLIGPNGSGKTTLFNVIMGSLKCNCGNVFFRGQEITGLRPHQICHRGISRTFQLTKPFGRMTCLENVMVGGFFGNDSDQGFKQTRNECVDVLHLVGLEHKHRVLAAGLNTIERKRLELARALATHPRLLLLDEIMAGLNPIEINAAVELIRKINHSGVTIVIVEHVMKALLGLSQRVVVLDAGRKIAEGTPREVVQNQDVIDAYFGENIRA